MPDSPADALPRLEARRARLDRRIRRAVSAYGREQAGVLDDYERALAAGRNGVGAQGVIVDADVFDSRVDDHGTAGD